MLWFKAHWLEILVFVLTSTTIRSTAHALILLIQRYAQTTETKVDDVWVATFSKRVEIALDTLDVIRRVVPGFVLGPLPSTQPLASQAPRSMPPAGAARLSRRPLGATRTWRPQPPRVQAPPPIGLPTVADQADGDDDPR